MALRYRGRDITDTDVAFIRELIAAHPAASRRALSHKLCEAWNWVQPNGELCDMVCRGMMLKLARRDLIELPARRNAPANPLAQRRRPALVPVEQSPVRCSLRELQPLEFRQVRRTPAEPLFNSLIEHHHYLGYTQPVGAHLKYLVYSGDQLLAALSLASPPRHLGPRDRFIGWPADVRRKNLHLIAYNPRFLLLPWVEVRYLASHVLGRMAKRIAQDWQTMYGHPLYFLETFVDPRRYRGTCYRAANWVVLGSTTGRGHNDRTNRRTQPIKLVLGYPLTRHFREHLCHGA